MKMICTYCSEVTECSCTDDHSKDFEDAKYVCDICMKLLGDGANENELKTHPKRKDIEQELKADAFADYFSQQLIENFFEPFWKMAKEDTRSMSKKEITRAAYEAGAHMAISLCSKMAMDQKLNTAITEVTQSNLSNSKEAAK